MSLSAAAGVKKVSASLKLPKGDFNACSRVFTNQLADTASDHFHFSQMMSVGHQYYSTTLQI